SRPRRNDLVVRSDDRLARDSSPRCFDRLTQLKQTPTTIAHFNLVADIVPVSGVVLAHVEAPHLLRVASSERSHVLRCLFRHWYILWSRAVMPVVRLRLPVTARSSHSGEASVPERPSGQFAGAF